MPTEMIVAGIVIWSEFMKKCDEVVAAALAARARDV